MDMLKALKKYYNRRKIYKIKKKYQLDDSCHVYSSFVCHLIEGSVRADVSIGKKCILAGQLVSAFNGKITFGDYSQIGPGSIVRCMDKVVIGELTSISTNVVISDNNNHPVNPYDRLIKQSTPPGSYERSWIHSSHAPIIIGRNCWIGENSRICKGVNIGEGSVVAANSVVTKDVPPFSIVAGNPAKIVKTNIDTTTPRVFSV